MWPRSGRSGRRLRPASSGAATHSVIALRALTARPSRASRSALVQHAKQVEQDDDRQGDADDPEKAAFTESFHDASSSQPRRGLIRHAVLEAWAAFPFGMM